MNDDELRPELELILAACVPRGAASSRGPTPRARVHELVGADLDYDFLLELAARHRVGPLVCRSLMDAGLERLPPAARARVEGALESIRFRNLVLLRELFAVLDALESRGIRALPYKGLVLAGTLYDDLSERQFADLDILVSRAEVPRVLEVLEEKGYERAEAGGSLPRMLERDCEVPMRRVEPTVLIEVHWEILPPHQAFGFRLGPFLERLIPGTLAGRALQVFPPEDLLVLLCVHGGEKHRWMRLQMICDVARLFVRHPALDWELARERARELGRERTLLLGSYLAWLLLDAPLPGPALEATLSKRGVRDHAALVAGRISRLDGGLPSYADYRRCLAVATARERRRGLDAPVRPARGRWLSAVLTPEWADRQALPLPRGLSFLHYATRPVRLFARHGLGLLRRA